MPEFHVFFRIEAATEAGLDITAMRHDVDIYRCGLGDGDVYMFPVPRTRKDHFYERLRNDGSFQMITVSSY